MPDDLVVVVEVLTRGGGEGWSAADLLRVRRLLADEHVGGEVGRAAMARVVELLAAHPDHP